jgi:anti-sigma factor RsiW
MGKSPQSGHVIGYRSMMEHRRIKDLLEAYTLDVLEPDERHAVQQHLATCTDCRRLADDLAATVDLLPLALAAASPLRPPTDLKDRVLHATQAPSLPLLAKRTEASGNKEMPEAPRLVARATSPATRWSVLPWQTGRWRTVAAAALLVVLGLSLVWGVRLSEALDQERALRERVAAHFSQQQEIVLEVVDADEATRLILRSPDPDSRAYGKLFTRPDLPHVVAMAARLPIPPEGQTYHLWLTSEGRTFLAGVLPVNDQGFGLLTFDADHGGPVYEAARLTLQAAGAEAPGGETVLAWSE